MAYFVAGSNIFGQWPSNELILSPITRTNLECKNLLKSSGLVQITWSYNILRTEDNFYLSGAWDEKINQLVKIPLPDDCTVSNKELIVTGNDYHLILVSKKADVLWVKDFKKLEIKKINFNIELPVEDAEKRLKIDSNISKVVLVNDSCLYLTLSGHVYSGVLPTYVDTRHCKGKIIDIQCGYEHYALLTDTGIVYTWGNGRRLQLGHGDVSNLELPSEVEALSGIKIIKISCGGWHSFALSEFGDLYAWGWNDTGQLGIKQEKGLESLALPTIVDLFDSDSKEVTINVKDLACGSRHSIILLENNTIWTTGCNKYGQLGFSEVKFPKISYFKKAFHCDTECTLMCGPWTSVIIDKK